MNEYVNEWDKKVSVCDKKSIGCKINIYPCNINISDPYNLNVSDVI